MNNIPTPSHQEMTRWCKAAGIKMDHNAVQLIIWASQWGYGEGYYRAYFEANKNE